MMWMWWLLGFEALAGIPAELEDARWQVLAREPTWVGCTEARGFTWCRSQGLVDGSMEELESLLNTFEDYPQIFDRVTHTTRLAPNTVHVVLDMPFPLASRDYVAQFERAQVGGVVRYGWSAVTHSATPRSTGAVRLVNAAGEWRLTPYARDQTTVTYTWNGELRGDFPEWAHTRAWEVQGLEVIRWLQEAVE